MIVLLLVIIDIHYGEEFKEVIFISISISHPYLLCIFAGVVSTVAGSTVSGYVDGVGTVAKLNNPFGVSVGSTGNAWVADTNNNMIRHINTAGKLSSPSPFFLFPLSSSYQLSF